jgi:hypothetical protein
LALCACHSLDAVAHRRQSLDGLDSHAILDCNQHTTPNLSSMPAASQPASQARKREAGTGAAHIRACVISSRQVAPHSHPISPRVHNSITHPFSTWRDTEARSIQSCLRAVRTDGHQLHFVREHVRHRCRSAVTDCCERAAASHTPEAEVDHLRNDLHMTLRLHEAAHHTCKPRVPSPHIIMHFNAAFSTVLTSHHCHSVAVVGADGRNRSASASRAQRNATAGGQGRRLTERAVELAHAAAAAAAY